MDIPVSLSFDLTRILSDVFMTIGGYDWSVDRRYSDACPDAGQGGLMKKHKARQHYLSYLLRLWQTDSGEKKI